MPLEKFCVPEVCTNLIMDWMLADFIVPSLAIWSIADAHPDSSIFTVLAVLSDSTETAVVDFIFFLPHWLLAKDTF